MKVVPPDWLFIAQSAPGASPRSAFRVPRSAFRVPRSYWARLGFPAKSRTKAAEGLLPPCSTVRCSLRPSSPASRTAPPASSSRRSPPFANANGYEARYAAIGAGGTPGPWQTGQVFPNTRTLAVNGLTPGNSYPIQVRALGGSTQYSDWSDSVQHMSL